jgi:hypothetical protein
MQRCGMLENVRSAGTEFRRALDAHDRGEATALGSLAHKLTVDLELDHVLSQLADDNARYLDEMLDGFGWQS